MRRVPESRLPVGAIVPFAGNAYTATDYLLCDGSAYSRTEYADLFAVIGTTYGAGDGSTTFNVPNLKGRVPVGLDAAQTEFDALGETGGSKTHTLTVSELPAHTHTRGQRHWNGASHGVSGRISAQATGGTGVMADSNSGNTGSTGGGAAHNNLQPYIVVNYLIKT